MRHENCIFMSESDCPLEQIKIDCETCKINNLTETIQNALEDYTQLGEAFTDVFNMFKKLIDNDGKTVAIETSIEHIFIINRVITTFLSDEEKTEQKDIVYQRLIFYFFKILIEEFENKEYEEHIIKYKH